MTNIYLKRCVKVVLGGGLIFNGVKSVIDNILRTRVIPQFGSIVYCDLAFGIIEHSGIYVGNDEIIHLNRFGRIEKVSLAIFTKQTPAITIYVSCKDGKAVGDINAGNFALTQLGNIRNYNVFTRNCHQFSSACLTGKIDNKDLFLTRLKKTAKLKIGVNEWRALAQ